MLRTGDKIQDYPSNLITWTCSIIKAQKYGSKACHVSAYGDHSTHPGGNTQICPCSSPAILPHLHLCSIVRDMGQYMHALYNEKHRMHAHACTHTQPCTTPHWSCRRDPICLVGTVVLRGVVRRLDICWPLLIFFSFVLTSSLVPLCVTSLCWVLLEGRWGLLILRME